MCTHGKITRPRPLIILYAVSQSSVLPANGVDPRPSSAGVSKVSRAWFFGLCRPHVHEQSNITNRADRTAKLGLEALELPGIPEDALTRCAFRQTQHNTVRQTQAEGIMMMRTRVFSAAAYMALCLGVPVALGQSRVDCSNIPALFDDLNALCCNGGGHRRAQGNAEAPPSDCTLTTCTPACAEVFVRMMEDCQPEMPVTGSAFSIVDQIPGADAFLSQCHDVLGSTEAKPPAPVTGSWQSVYGQFLAVDPGMLHSSDTRGDGATAWGVWRTDPGSTGVHFTGIQALEQTGRAPRGWTF
eukprot:COSAG02_NODE_18182_length_955_cov_1.325935_1_plen_298_part_10